MSPYYPLKPCPFEVVVGLRVDGAVEICATSPSSKARCGASRTGFKV
jgi:hypothetical protein